MVADCNLRIVPEDRSSGAEHVWLGVVTTGGAVLLRVLLATSGKCSCFVILVALHIIYKTKGRLSDHLLFGEKQGSCGTSDQLHTAGSSNLPAQ